VNDIERFQHNVTIQLLERAADAWSRRREPMAERLAASAWALMGSADFVDIDEPDHPKTGHVTDGRAVIDLAIRDELIAHTVTAWADGDLDRAERHARTLWAWWAAPTHSEDR
jgi:hypothetical protein